jgi:hypothetical protein
MEWLSALIGGVAGAITNSLWQLFSAWFLAGRNTRLKNSEFLFQKELEAVSQFMALRRRIMPSYRFPEMEWHDACEDFAGRFERAEKEIREFISKHGAALDPTGGKFEVRVGEVSEEGIKIAEEVMNGLEKLEGQLQQSVRNKAGTRL